MAVAQNLGAQDYFASAADFARIYVGAVEPQYPKAVWHDIPYYKGTTDVYHGRISYYGVVYDKVQLRFDQLEQRVVVLSPVGKIFCLPEQEHIDWFEMDGYRYVHDPENGSRFSSLLCDGKASDGSIDGNSPNGIRLYHSVWKIYSGERALEGKKYLKTLNTQEHYTLMTPDGVTHHVKRASDVATLFPEQKKQIRQFARKNHLSFSKSEREASLVRLIKSLTPSFTPNPSIP